VVSDESSSLEVLEEDQNGNFMEGLVEKEIKQE